MAELRKDRHRPIRNPMSSERLERRRTAFLNTIAADRKVSSAGKSVAVLLALKHLDEDGAASLSVPAMAAELGLCERSIQMGVRSLASAGHITVKRRPPLVNVYIIAVPAHSEVR